MSTSAQIGVTGLAVMGRNLARNFARNGYTVAVHNRTPARTHALVEEFGHEGEFIAAETAKEFVAALERPRRLVIMVKAGEPTDAVIREFAPVLAANGGGAMVNVLSVLSWLAAPPSALYCAAKAASWSLTNSLRLELAAQHTQVVAVHVGFMDTDMTARLNVPKSSPDDIARLVLDAVQRGDSEVLADDVSRHVKAALSGELTLLYPAIAS